MRIWWTASDGVILQFMFTLFYDTMRNWAYLYLGALVNACLGGPSDVLCIAIPFLSVAHCEVIGGGDAGMM